MVLLPGDRVDEAELVVLVTPVLSEAVLARLRGLATDSVLVLDQLGEIPLSSAAQLGVVGALWRAEATPERFAQMVLTICNGGSDFPPEMHSLVADVAQRQPDALASLEMSVCGLYAREVAILRLLAAGLDTSEIAQRVMYSERTVKGILHEVMTRLCLRNRSQAVAYAMRAGLF